MSLFYKNYFNKPMTTLELFNIFLLIENKNINLIKVIIKGSK